ncbi:TonB-dependent receptor [bacterium]|nr:MAG: TonB-dependent receptor [bacterium]
MVKKLLAINLLVMLLMPLAAFSQAKLTGKVTDASTGELLPGANVLITELSRGTATSIDGTYTIENLPAGSYTLSVSYIGYKTKSESITIASGDNMYDIALNPDFLGLEEVVVTGLGVQTKKTLTSSIAKISADELSSVPVISPDQLMQGQAAGVVVTASSGTPGGGISVRVRGSTSISGSNEPLYIVDGVPVSSGDFTAIGTGNQGLNVMASLAPEDIESMEVLKDASATAVYGARGANGVVLITTKRGKSGKSKINFGYTFGTKEFANKLDFLNAGEMMGIYMEGVYGDYLAGDANNDGEIDNYPSAEDMYAEFVGAFGNAPSAYFGSTYFGEMNTYSTDFSKAPTTNWQDEVFRSGVVKTYTLSAQGGDAKTRYYISGNYYDEEGVMIGSGFGRMSGRLNLDHTFSEKAGISASVGYSRSESQRIENDNNIYGVLTNAYLSLPTKPVYTDSTKTRYTTTLGAFSNPVAQSKVQNDVVTTQFIGNVTADYTPISDLQFKLVAGLERFDVYEDQFAPSFTNQGSPLGNGVSSITFNQTWLTELSASYRKKFMDAHTIDVIGVASYQETIFDRTFATGDQYPTDEVRTVASAAITTGSQSGSSNGLESYTGRLGYNFKEKYLVNFAARLDGSSRFSEDNRYGFFPSAALGWRLSEESFLKGIEALNELKLRLSYGFTGNQPSGDFTSLGLFGVAAYGSTPALAPSQIANPNLKWEETEQTNIGLDFVLVKERISGSFDYYIKNTSDLILARPVPATTGFTSYQSNVGDIENKGWELQIKTINVSSNDFVWSTTLNLSQNKNKVLSLVDDQPFSSGFGSRVQVGQPLGAFYGYVTDGLWNTQAEIDEYLTANPNASVGNATPGDIRFKDIDGDGRITGADQTIIGDANPDLFGGIRNVFTYKGFEFNTLFQFSLGNDIFNANRQFYEHIGYSYNHTKNVLDRWTPQTANTATLPKASWNDSNSNTRDSDFYVEDGSFIRLKALTLAYTVDRKIMNKAGLESLRVYLTGNNLLTWTDYSGPDPEVSTFDGSNTAFGTDFFTYPQARSIIFGVNIGF